MLFSRLEETEIVFCSISIKFRLNNRQNKKHENYLFGELISSFFKGFCFLFSKCNFIIDVHIQTNFFSFHVKKTNIFLRGEKWLLCLQHNLKKAYLQKRIQILQAPSFHSLKELRKFTKAPHICGLSGTSNEDEYRDMECTS